MEFVEISDRNVKYAALAVSIVSFVVYLTTLAPGLDFIDSGELSTDVYTLGICHPTGYPFFTLVGFLFSHLPIASSIIYRLNLMAALFTSVGAGGLVLVMNEILEHWITWQKKIAKKERTKQTPANRKRAVPKPKTSQTEQIESDRSGLNVRAALIASIATGLAAAFSATWWEQSTSIEVYPLHLLLVPLVLYFFLRMLRNQPIESSGLSRDGIFFAITLGLAFANHMTTVLLAPACIFLYFSKRGFKKEAWVLIAKLAIPFCATLLLYLYLPLRASESPIMDWGNPTTLGAFLRHVTGGQYKIWMFTGSAAEQWKYFWNRVPIEFTILGLLMSLVGLFGILTSARKTRWKLLIFTALLFFGCLFYAINYGIHDIDSYFLLAYLTIAIWTGIGSYFITDQFKERKRGIMVGIAISALLVGFELYSNFSEDDESGNHMVDDYATNLLMNLPPHAIIFSTLWDFWLSGAYYYQLVERLRPDVLVVDKAMLHDRAWYYRYLDKRAPDVMAKVKQEETAFLKYLTSFDNGDPYDHDAIGATYNTFITALIERNRDRPLYVTSEVLQDKSDPFFSSLKPVPVGIAFRLLAPQDTVQPTLPRIVWRDAEYRRRNYYTDKSRQVQAMPLAATAQRLLSEGRYAEALQFVQLALRFSPAESMDGLSGRDYETALDVNDQFMSIEQLKQRIQQLLAQRTHS